ncbi:Rrf2 family transcriptional regulator [Paludibacterium yongneupense]|nr:Rrf2 family transcriptional regulator [Paludibacterium yongneupense]
MNKSSRFAVSVHILTLLALKSTPVPSSYIAASVNTNPAMIRRILVMLGNAGLTRACMGANGGTSLARAPSDIPLLEIYRAVDDPVVLSLHHSAPNTHCPVGCRITEVLENVIDRAEAAMQATLADISVADVVEKLQLEAHPA